MNLEEFRRGKLAAWDDEHKLAAANYRDHPAVNSYLSRIGDAEGKPENIVAGAIRARLIPADDAESWAERNWARFFGTADEPGAPLIRIVCGEVEAEPLTPPAAAIEFDGETCVVPVAGGIRVQKRKADIGAPVGQRRVSKAAVNSAKWVLVDYRGEQVAVTLHEAFEYGLREVAQWQPTDGHEA